MPQARPSRFLPAVIGCLLLGTAFCVSDVSSVLADEEGISVQAASLRGVEAVYVEAVADSEFAAMDFDSKALQGRVGFRLFQAGTHILSEDAYSEDPDAVLVFVNLNMLRPAGTGVVYYISIAVLQPVSLVRDPEFRLAATTWRTDELGNLTTVNMVTLQEVVDRKTDELVNDLRAANPTD